MMMQPNAMQCDVMQITPPPKKPRSILKKLFYRFLSLANGDLHNRVLANRAIILIYGRSLRDRGVIYGNLASRVMIYLADRVS